METTLSFIKHSSLQRGLVGLIINRFEQKGLHLVGIKMIQMDQKMAEKHYGEHKDKPFFASLVKSITAAPIVVMAWRGINAVQVVRNIMGSTNPTDALMGTIRGDMGHFVGDNLVHGSDSLESAKREISLFFRPEELHVYQMALAGWLGYDEKD